MPNWSLTEYSITNKDQNLLETLKKEFDNAFQITKIKNDFGEKWLGNILSYLGMSDDEVLASDCKGWTEYNPEIEFNADSNTYTLYMFSETAWEPIPNPLQKMVEKFAPDSEILYYSETPNSNIYTTNDPNMVGKRFEKYDDDLLDDEENTPNFWEYVPLKK